MALIENALNVYLEYYQTNKNRDLPKVQNAN